MIINLPESVFKWQQSNKHFQEFYPQDGGENQLAQMWNEITSLSPFVLSTHFSLWPLRWNKSALYQLLKSARYNDIS